MDWLYILLLVAVTALGGAPWAIRKIRQRPTVRGFVNYDLTQSASHSRWVDVVWIAAVIAAVILFTSVAPRVRWDREKPAETQLGLLK